MIPIFSSLSTGHIVAMQEISMEFMDINNFRIKVL
jgi:hypothetical protein